MTHHLRKISVMELLLLENIKEGGSSPAWSIIDIVGESLLCRNALYYILYRNALRQNKAKILSQNLT